MDVQVEINGATPLVYHNPRLADKDDEFSKAKSEISSKGKKTPTDNQELEHLNFLGSLYWEPEMGLYLPTWNVLACLIRAATVYKLGKAVQRGVAQTSLNTPITHNGPADPEAMWQKVDLRLRKPVVVDRKRITTVRPVFREWSTMVDFLVMEDVISLEDFTRVAELAGRSEGLGDARKLGYGRFTVKVRVLEDAA